MSVDVRACPFCGYEFDWGLLGKYGCPNCEAEGCGEGGLHRLSLLLSRYSFQFGDELTLQNGVEAVLEDNGIAYNREAIVTQGERIDFVCQIADETIALECKVTGGPTEVLRQLLRYAGLDGIDSILLVTSRSRHRFNITELNGKPLAVHWVGGGAL